MGEQPPGAPRGRQQTDDVGPNSPPIAVKVGVTVVLMGISAGCIATGTAEPLAGALLVQVANYWLPLRRGTDG